MSELSVYYDEILALRKKNRKLSEVIKRQEHTINSLNRRTENLQEEIKYLRSIKNIPPTEDAL